MSVVTTISRMDNKIKSRMVLEIFIIWNLHCWEYRCFCNKC